MPRISLTQGAYEARSIIANAQRCLNLYPEKNQKDSPAPMTHYPTPGLVLDATAPMTGEVRCIYTATNGNLYAVVAQNVYYIATSMAWEFTLLGTIETTVGAVDMNDNGLAVLLVDGTEGGWAIDLEDNSFGAVTPTNFYGGNRVGEVDTYFVLNRPGTNQFYISLSQVSFAMLTGGPLLTGTISNSGTGYQNGTYADIPMTGGSGTGATADIVVGGGPIVTGSIANAGTTYTNGAYNAVALTGGSGTGATANITVSGTIISAVTIVSGGTGYLNTDTLSVDAASVGGTGSGFVYTVDSINGTVSSVTIVNGGTSYREGDILGVSGGGGSGFAYTVLTIGGSAFDALDIAAKVGYSDQMVATLVVNRQIWLFGEVTTEVWYNSGAADFTFQRIDGVFIEHGCAAPASVAKQDSSLYWLSQDKQGSFMVMRNAGYQAVRISTHAIENEISSYTVINDAIGYTYLQEGHVFYVLTFPTANRTWVYDIATELWHERGWFNENGNQFRHRSNCHTYYMDRNLVGDFQNGKIYHFDLDSGLDNGDPIPRIRSFPHLMNDGKRVRYLNFIADMQVGELQDIGTEDQPIVSLRWSDTRGASWGNYIQQSMGAPGEYLKSLQFRRLGMARDRVFELSWSTPIKTALNGAFIEMSASAT